MRARLAILVSLSAIIWPAFAQDRLPTLTVGHITFTNVLILRVTATDICISSASGIANAKLADLDPALQARFAPEAAKADAIEKQQAAVKTEYARFLALQPAPPPATDASSGTAAADSGASSTNQPIAKSLLNQPGPDLAVEKWISAAPITAGRFVLIDFWATTNEPSRNFIPKLNEFQNQFTTNLAIIGISHETEDDVRKIVVPNIEYSSAIDTEARMETALELRKLPYALLMDFSNIVRWEGNPLSTTNGLSDNVISSLIEKYPRVPDANPNAAP